MKILKYIAVTALTTVCLTGCTNLDETPMTK